MSWRQFCSDSKLLLTKGGLILFLAGSIGCASAPHNEQQAAVAEDAAAITVNPDPWENLNRKIFAFNHRLDRWILRPVAKGYKTITPNFVELGIGNFFNNLDEVSNALNSALQWKWGQAGNDSGRLLLNSTVGLAGLFDVASKAGLPRSEGEDFGQTLAVWGVESGPYLMLPFLGPATLRDGVSKFADRYTNPVTYVDPTEAEWGLRIVDVIDSRAQLLQADSLIAGDSYVLLRDFYLQRRNYLINDGEIEDDFGGDGYGEDDYYYDSDDDSGY